MFVELVNKITKEGDGRVKEAIVYKDRTGYWVAEDSKTHTRIGNYCDSELEAYKLANRGGYVVR
uniref:Uncharacterized protein n=1 Tax=viral metagenome TaxID=1070528 RepID=A0A6M3KW60_9ZZZZ